MHISYCVGCNYCWLKTPGICAIKDDYEPILKKMSKTEQVWLISDARFGFASYQTKNIVDRVMPIVTMYLKIKDGQIRKVMRYDHKPNIGIIYTGDGDQIYLERWCQRIALNFGSHSLGAFHAEHRKEAGYLGVRYGGCLVKGDNAVWHFTGCSFSQTEKDVEANQG